MSLKKIVKFSAKWCAPCQSFAPIFDKVCEEYADKFNTEKVDVDGATEEQNKMMQDLGVRSIPTTVFLDENDSVIKKIIGSVSEQDLKNIIEDELNT